MIQLSPKMYDEAKMENEPGASHLPSITKNDSKWWGGRLRSDSYQIVSILKSDQNPTKRIKWLSVMISFSSLNCKDQIKCLIDWCKRSCLWISAEWVLDLSWHCFAHCYCLKWSNLTNHHRSRQSHPSLKWWRERWKSLMSKAPWWASPTETPWHCITRKSLRIKFFSC